MRFDLTDLRLFLLVVEHGSLTAGARAMHLALASVSERISGMEAALGTPVLERTRRGVRTTAAGEALLGHARLILGQVEQMHGDLRGFGEGLRGRVRLWANTAATATFLPQQVCRFLVAHPDLSIDLNERTSGETVLAIAQERADLGIAADTSDLTGLQIRPIALDQLVVLAEEKHPIAAQSRVPFAEILRESCVGLSDAALEKHLAQRAALLGHQLHYRVRLRNPNDLIDAVHAGIGIAILSEAHAAKLDRPGVARRPLSEPWTARRLYLCARDFNNLTPQALLLAEHLLADSQHHLLADPQHIGRPDEQKPTEQRLRRPVGSEINVY
jgi:DNA-binding transcriptional LysR family regulator